MKSALWNSLTSSSGHSDLKAEAEGSFETSIYLYQAARRHIRENAILFFILQVLRKYLGSLNFRKWETHNVMCWCCKVVTLVTILIIWYSNK
jgi:hypothetical protein